MAAYMFHRARIRVTPAFAGTIRLPATTTSIRPQRASTFVERTKRLVAGSYGEHLVDVPLALGLFELLDFI
jgi:hypothetical protein